MEYIVKKEELQEILKKLEDEEARKKIPDWLKPLPYEKEAPIFDNIIKLVLEKLDEGAKSVYILEADIKSMISYLYDELHLLGRFRKRLRGTGLSVVAINDIKINGGKRTYRVYNTKIRLGIIDTEK